MSRNPASRVPRRLSLLLAPSSVLLFSLALALGSTALAATKKPTSSDGKKLPAKVTFIDSPSSESPAARKKRLKVECKGRPNAGACLGMTR